MPQKILLHFASLILLLCSFSSARATQITGRVTDEDGDILGFASVLVKGTTLGTTANAEGYYNLNLPAGSYTLLAQHIGYKQGQIELKITTDQKSLTQNFVLKIQGYELKDIVVKSSSEDPAYRIIRNAIKKRPVHLKKTQSFQSNIYLKGVLRNRNTPNSIMGIKLKEEDKQDMKSSMGLDSAGKGVIYLAEQVADYYQEGKKRKLIIQSVKESGDPNGLGMGNVPSVINFYENNVTTLMSSGANSLGFNSPISDNALNAYRYKLEGSFVENGRYIYKIKVTPKRDFERCFIGDLYISDEDWAIHSLKLRLTPRQGLDMLDTLITEQLYIPLSKDLWVIKNQIIYPTINIFGFDISGNFVTVYNNQKVNEAIPDSIFNKKIRIQYSKDATQRDSSYWLQLRPLALEQDETSNYGYRDSVFHKENDPALRDSLRRKSNKASVGEFLLSGIGYSSKGYKRSFSLSPAITDINFNTVEGLNYAPSISYRQRIDSNKRLDAAVNLRYGFTNTRFNAKANLKYTQQQKDWSGRYWYIAATGGKYITQLNNDNPVGEWINSYTSLVERHNYLKIYERWVLGMKAGRHYGNGFSWNASVHYEDRIPLSNTTNFSFVREKPNQQGYTDNLPIHFVGIGFNRHQALIAQLEVHWQPGVRYIQYPDKKVPLGSKAPRFEIMYQKGIPNVWGSSSNFDKWHFQILDDINLKRLGSLAYNIGLGGFMQNAQVNIPDLKHLRGNQYSIAAPYLQSFQLAPFYLYSNADKIYSELHIEYYLKGLISNKIPILRKAHWYFVLGNNTFYSQQRYYTESFVGIDNLGFKIFRGFRIDFIKGWDQLNRNYTGLRLGYKLGSSVKLNLGNSNKADLF